MSQITNPSPSHVAYINFTLIPSPTFSLPLETLSYSSPPFLPNPQHTWNSHTVMIASPLNMLKTNALNMPLLHATYNQGCPNTTPPTLTSNIRGAIHHSIINQLKDLHIPMPQIQTLQNNVIEYLAYLILNKRKLGKKQSLILLP